MIIRISWDWCVWYKVKAVELWFQKPITVSSNQYIITDNGVKILSMLPFKKTAGSSLVSVHTLLRQTTQPLSMFVFLCVCDGFMCTDSGFSLVTVDQLCVCCSVPQALGLSTARGRGRCKNPACDYVYKNRHKPQRCPTCGCELANKPTKKNKLTVSSSTHCTADSQLKPN